MARIEPRMSRPYIDNIQNVRDTQFTKQTLDCLVEGSKGDNIQQDGIGA